MDSMQLSFDSKGNSVPTILLLMQERLYAQGGLKVQDFVYVYQYSIESFVQCRCVSFTFSVFAG